MAQTAQVNVRMDATLKQAGDAALEEAGLTPSAAVRALWQKASKRGQDLEEVVQLCRPADTAANAPAPAAKASLLRGSRIVEAGMQALDISQLHVQEGSDAELLEAALLERYEGRGLL